jgi:phosphoserine phosphatase SerB
MTIVLFDLDETLVNGRVIDALALEYGFFYDLNRLRSRFKFGQIPHEELTRSIGNLLKGIKTKDIYQLVKRIPLMPNTKKLIDHLKYNRYKVGVISDGYKVVTDSFALKFGFNYSIGHEVEVINGVLTGKVNLVTDNGDYIHWKGKKIKQIKKESNEKIIAVGNGDLDAPMLEESDFGIAFNATPKAKIASDIVVNKKDMDDVLTAIVRSRIIGDNI